MSKATFIESEKLPAIAAGGKLQRETLSEKLASTCSGIHKEVHCGYFLRDEYRFNQSEGRITMRELDT